MLFAPLVSTVSIRSFRRVGQRVGQGENSPLKKLRRSNQRVAELKQVHFKL